MNIDRRTFLKIMGAFGAGVAASGIEMPGGVARIADDISLPAGPLSVRAAPSFSSMRELPGEFIITQISTSVDTAVYYSSGGPQRSYVDATPTTVELEAVAYCDGATAARIMNYFRNHMPLPIWHQEWLCAYCGSPQPIHKTHCAQCGGAREWIVT